MKYKSLTFSKKRELLESLDPTEVAKALNAFTGISDEAPVQFISEPKREAAYGVPTVEEAVLDYIRKIEGYRIRLREFHWSVSKKSEHELTDGAISMLEGFEDEIAENMQGLLGIRIKIGDLIPIMPDTNFSLGELLENIVYTTVVMKETIPQAGVKGTDGLEDLFIQIIREMNKLRYLATFS